MFEKSQHTFSDMFFWGRLGKFQFSWPVYDKSVLLVADSPVVEKL